MIKRWLPVFIWAVVIFYFSSLPSLPGADKNWLDFIVKKGAHVSEYAIFFFLLSGALKSINWRTPYQTAFLIGLFYAFTDETHQLFTPGRTGLLRDALIFDQLGLLLAWLFKSRREK